MKFASFLVKLTFIKLDFLQSSILKHKTERNNTKNIFYEKNLQTDVKIHFILLFNGRKNNKYNISNCKNLYGTHKTSYILCRSMSLRQSCYLDILNIERTYRITDGVSLGIHNMLSMKVAMHQPSLRWPYQGSCHNTSRATRAEY